MQPTYYAVLFSWGVSETEEDFQQSHWNKTFGQYLNLDSKYFVNASLKSDLQGVFLQRREPAAPLH